jgi:hypothetical protein
VDCRTKVQRRFFYLGYATLQATIFQVAMAGGESFNPTRVVDEECAVYQWKFWQTHNKSSNPPNAAFALG